MIRSFLALVLLGTSAYADPCINISGNYLNIQPNGMKIHLTVSQNGCTEADAVYTYSNGFQAARAMIFDGQQRTSFESEDTVIYEAFTINANDIIVDSENHYNRENRVVLGNGTISLDAFGNFVEHTDYFELGWFRGHVTTIFQRVP